MWQCNSVVWHVFEGNCDDMEGGIWHYMVPPVSSVVGIKLLRLFIASHVQVFQAKIKLRFVGRLLSRKIWEEHKHVHILCLHSLKYYAKLNTNTTPFSTGNLPYLMHFCCSHGYSMHVSLILHFAFLNFTTLYSMEYVNLTLLNQYTFGKSLKSLNLTKDI